MKRILTLAAILFLSLIQLQAQSEGNYQKEDKVISFDSKIYDFGDVLLSEGALKHSFIFKNISTSPIVIHNVISSCGCTIPEWTKEPVRPGAEGRIDVVFSNDQGPYPFDKTLTVYVSNVDRPVILRIRGTAHESRKDIDELFTLRIGQMGLRKTGVSIGYVDQGSSKSDNMQIANMGHTDLRVETTETDPGLSVTVSPNPIPARSMAKVTYTVDLKQTSGNDWGKKSYGTSFLLNGKKADGRLTVNATIKDNFDDYTKEQLNSAPVPTTDKSYFEFGDVKAGKVAEYAYTIRNKGKDPLTIYKVEGQSKGLQVLTSFPVTVKAGGKADIKVRFDTSSSEGEVIEVVSVITNSPSKPIMNLFVTGIVLK